MACQSFEGPLNGRAAGPGYRLLETERRPEDLEFGEDMLYTAAIRAGWFTIISMVGAHGTLQDAEIEQAVERTPGYVLLTDIGGAPTWIYTPAYRVRSLGTSGR